MNGMVFGPLDECQGNDRVSRTALLCTGTVSALASCYASVRYCDSMVLAVSDAAVFGTTLLYHTQGGSRLLKADLAAVGTSLALHMCYSQRSLVYYMLPMALYGASKLTKDGELLGGIDVFHGLMHLAGLYANWVGCQ